MILWLWRLFWGENKSVCEHKFSPTYRINVYATDLTGKRVGEFPRNTKFVLTCQKCGIITSTTV